MNDLVSVIITTYKRPEFLKRAIDSVLAQTYNNIELIVVDDNEPDGEFRRETEKLIMTNFSNEERLHYVKMPSNSGSCPARNKGVSLSKGKYINFLDDDDVFLPTKIEKQMRLFDSDTNEELAVVGCFADIVNANGDVIGKEEIRFKGNAFFQEMCSNIATTSLALIRKNVYIKSGGFETMYSSQEHWMFMKVFSVLSGYDYEPETLVKIYHHDGERISTNKKKPLGAIQLFEKSKVFLSRFKPSEISEIQKSLNTNIIVSYVQSGDRINALRYLFKRRKFSSLFSKQSTKLLLMSIIGWKYYSLLSSLSTKK